jgi:hypothetical protein
MKYSEFTTPRKSEANPELFEEMKALELKQKQEQKEAREALERERKA